MQFRQDSDGTLKPAYFRPYDCICQRRECRCDTKMLGPAKRSATEICAEMFDKTVEMDQLNVALGPGLKLA